mmetsp:Transcript_42010/g.62184  ORF Transcript_42010/g.62184 Transcript_42010/m.62184 type:complete len:170 (-) Transcript_42010:640-1149(-)
MAFITSVVSSHDPTRVNPLGAIERRPYKRWWIQKASNLVQSTFARTKEKKTCLSCICDIRTIRSASPPAKSVEQANIALVSLSLTMTFIASHVLFVSYVSLDPSKGVKWGTKGILIRLFCKLDRGQPRICADCSLQQQQQQQHVNAHGFRFLPIVRSGNCESSLFFSQH